MHKKIIKILLIFGAIIVIFFVFFYRGEISINLKKPANIQINKKNYENQKSIKKRLWPKKYQIIVSREGYEEYSQEIEIKPFKKNDLAISLEPKLEKLESPISSSYFINNDVYYFDSSTGKLTKLNLKNKEKTQISNELDFNVKRAIWSPKGEKALLFSDEYRPKTYLFNLNKEVKNINGEYELIADWSEDSNKILSVSFDLSGSNSLVIIKDDGSITGVTSNIINPSFLRWWDKNYLTVYASTNVGDADYIFEITDLKNNVPVYRTNEYVKNAEFLKNRNSAVYEVSSEDEKISTLNILRLDTKKVKNIFKGSIKKWIQEEDKIVIINYDSELSILSLDGKIEKQYKVSEINQLENISNFHIFENKIFLEGSDNLYSLILKEK